MTDDDDDFFSAVDLDEDNTPKEVRYGLVVPMRALTPEENDGRDELAEGEYEFRMKGGQRVIFDESELDETTMR
jgi:hypothetical protein